MCLDSLGRASVWSLVLAAFMACSPPSSPSPRLPPEASSPEAILRLVRQRERRIRSLRARFVAVTAHDGKERHADGVLLVHKPDRFRLRLFLPLGVTVLDYVSVGSRAQLSLPLQGRFTSEPPDGDYAPFSREDLGEAFLRGSHAFPGTCMPRRAGSDSGVVVVCRSSAGSILRRIRIDASTATIREETSYAGGMPRMTIRFGDYRETDGTPLPEEIEMSYPGRRLSVSISIRRYELNPSLSDALFAMTPASGS